MRLPMLSNAPCRRGTDRRRRRFHPTLLRLEDRTVLSPTIFVVTNTADSGPGSLRQAILYADANDSVPETISFNIPTTDPGFANGVFTIQPHSDRTRSTRQHHDRRDDSDHIHRRHQPATAPRSSSTAPSHSNGDGLETR